MINALCVSKRVSLSASQLLLERLFIILNLFVQDSFKDFTYGAQDSFSSKIRPNILMVSVNFISKSLRYSIDGTLNLIFLVNRFLGDFIYNFKPVVFDQSCTVLIAVCKCSFIECTFFPLHVSVMSAENNWAFIGGLRW